MIYLPCFELYLTCIYLVVSNVYQDILVVTNLDVTNPNYITFADCTWTGNWFPLFYFCYK